MKKLLTILITFFFLSSYAQEQTLEYTNYCLYKFQQEQKRSMLISFSGAATITLANLDFINGVRKTNKYYETELAVAGENTYQRILAEKEWQNELDKINTRNVIITATGAAIIVAGQVMLFRSYRWLKRAYIVPAEQGIGVAIKF